MSEAKEQKMDLQEAVRRFEEACDMPKNTVEIINLLEKTNIRDSGVFQIDDGEYWIRIFRHYEHAGIWIWKVIDREKSPGGRPNLFSHLISIEEFDRLKQHYLL